MNDKQPTYEITVWEIDNGDIKEKYWIATADELDDVLHQYRDEPEFEVQFEERP